MRARLQPGDVEQIANEAMQPLAFVEDRAQQLLTGLARS